jgi:acetylornithine deacetylase/succinyl-diaminopimelate desuccinylase-like protein
VLSQPGKGDIPVVMIGFGLPDDRTHAPNEKFHLPNFYNGIDTVIHYLELFTGV